MMEHCGRIVNGRPDPPRVKPADWPDDYKFSTSKYGQAQLVEPEHHRGWELSDLKDKRFHDQGLVLLMAVNPEQTQFELYIMDYHDWHAACTLGTLLGTIDKARK